MTLPATVVLECTDVVPNSSCNGNFGYAFVSMGLVPPSAYVQLCGSGGFDPLNQLPSGSLLVVFDANGNVPTGGQCQPASNFVFGSGVPYTPAFDISQLDTTQMSQAFAAGFLLIGVAMATGKGITLVLSMIKG